MKFQADQERLFWYWINERHSIYLKRKANERWPWTKDEILQKYKFTNVYRQLDRTTQELTKRLIRMPKTPEDLLFSIVVFRLFNWPETYDALAYGMRLHKWHINDALRILQARQMEGRKIFTGAYIIPNCGSKDAKVKVICEALDAVSKDRRALAKRIERDGSMEAAVAHLRKYHTIGGFIAYEIACDLRFTPILSRARDIYAWAHAGPGALRGLSRLCTGQLGFKISQEESVTLMRRLYQKAEFKLRKVHKETEGWPFEMREIEHSLCEFDKYMRVKNGEGSPRSRYYPKLEEQLEMKI